MPDFKYIVKKTTDFSESEWVEFSNSFNEAFSKEKTVEEIRLLHEKNIYEHATVSYCLDVTKNKIVAATAMMPYIYEYKGQEVLTALSGSSFVLPEARSNILLFKKLYFKVRDFIKEEGYKAILGVPNKNSYQYSKKMFGTKDLFQLDYFILPVLSGNIAKLGLLRIILKKISLIYLRLFGIINHIEKIPLISHKDTTEFYKKRFPGYKGFENSKCFGYYKTFIEERKKTTYIFEFKDILSEKRTSKALYALVRHIIKTEDTDFILFVGKMNFRFGALLKVPQKFIPKTLPLVIDVIDNNFKDEFLLPDNWSFSLINLDVR